MTDTETLGHFGEPRQVTLENCMELAAEYAGNSDKSMAAVGRIMLAVLPDFIGFLRCEMAMRGNYETPSEFLSALSNAISNMGTLMAYLAAPAVACSCCRGKFLRSIGEGNLTSLSVMAFEADISNTVSEALGHAGFIGATHGAPDAKQ